MGRCLLIGFDLSELPRGHNAEERSESCNTSIMFDLQSWKNSSRSDERAATAEPFKSRACQSSKFAQPCFAWPRYTRIKLASFACRPIGIGAAGFEVDSLR